MIDDYGYGKYNAEESVGCKNCIICNNTIMVGAYALSNEGLLCAECKRRLNKLLYKADGERIDDE